MIRTVGCPVLAAIRRKDSSICSCNSSTPFSYLMSEAISDHQRPSILIDLNRGSSTGNIKGSIPNLEGEIR